MTSSRFPERLDPFKFADQEKTIDATLKLDYLSRFRQELHSSKGEISCIIKGFKDRDTRKSSLKVNFSGEVELVCQGCLEAFMYKLDRQAVLYPVTTEEQMKRVPEDGEPVLVEEEGLDIKSAIEDELILSIPLIPLYGQCEELDTYQTGELPEEVIQEAEKKKNPFSELKNFKFD